MIITVFSDSHDRMDKINEALQIVQEREVKNGIHLGDFCTPAAMKLLAASGINWKCVWGNIDGDRLRCYQEVAPYGTVDIVPEDFREIEVEGRHLFLTHYPEIARIAALSGKYDAVFHGHNHVAAQETVETAHGRVKEVLLANPGEICGFRFGEPSFALYNTESNTFEHIRLKNL